MKNAIQIGRYSSSDWHDWKQSTEWLFDVEKEQFREIFLKKFTEWFRPEGMPERLPEEGTVTVTIVIGEVFKYNEATGKWDKHVRTEYGEAEITFAENEILVNYEGQLCGRTWFILKEITPDTVFLPIQEFIGAAKLTPLEQRCYTPYYHDFEEAKKAYESLPMRDEWRFMDTQKSWVVEKESELLANPWYQTNIAIAQYPNADKHWHPLCWAQLENIVDEIMLKYVNTKDICEKNEDNFINRLDRFITLRRDGRLTKEEEEIINLLYPPRKTA